MGGIVPATNHASAALMPYIRACMFLGMSPVATQAERSARSRSALLESAARGISRHGYGNLVLKDVAREAGYTRGASTTSSRTRRTWRLRSFAGPTRLGGTR